MFRLREGALGKSRILSKQAFPIFTVTKTSYIKMILLTYHGTANMSKQVFLDKMLILMKLTCLFPGAANQTN